MWGLFVEMGNELKTLCPIFLAYTLHDVAVKFFQPFPVLHDNFLRFFSESNDARIGDIVVFCQQPFPLKPASPAFKDILAVLVKIF